MPENNEPIYDFNSLKTYLEEHGFVVGTNAPYRIVKPEEVTPEVLRNGSIRFDAEGIFVKDMEGKEHQVFLYKRDYRMRKYGKPRYHIRMCQIIKDFINSGGFNDHYMRTNSEPVDVIDLDDGRRRKQVSNLPLCRFCSSILWQHGNIDSSQFVEILKSVRENNQDLELDLFGYTRDWQEISLRFRENKNFICETCGLHIDDMFEQRQFMHCHHINGDKTDNRDSNLKCLCLYCHAHVNEHHLKRLTTGGNRVLYNDFIRKYKPGESEV